MAFKLTGEGTWQRPQTMMDSKAKAPPPKMKAAPAAASDRPSTLLTRCRNIAGGFSAASLQSSSSAESSSPRASKPPTAPHRAKGKGLPSLEDDEEDYAAAEVSARAILQARYARMMSGKAKRARARRVAAMRARNRPAALFIQSMLLEA